MSVAAAPAMRDIACNLCGARDERRVRAIEASWLVRCNRCGLGYINPQPSPEAIESLYSEEYFTHSDGLTYGYTDYMADQANILKTFDLRYRYIERFIRPGRMLDVGCAYGFSLIAAQRRGWQAKGLELAGDVAQAAREQLGLDVEQGTLEAFAERGERFDLVTLWDVIEHVPDPMAVIHAASRALAPGGLLVLMTPNIDSAISKLTGNRWVMYHRGCVEHIFYFSPKTMRDALERAGFGVRACRQWGLGGKFVDLDFVFTRLATYAKPFGLARAAVKRLGMGSWALYGDLGDNLVAVAQKPA